MKINIQIEKDTNKQEIIDLLTRSFSQYISSKGEREVQDGQRLEEWFDIDGMYSYLKSGNGQIIAARENANKLIGLSFVGKQNILNWPDGNKAELFVIAVDVGYRRYKIGTKLLLKSEECAKDFKAKSIILNTHVDQRQSRLFYEKNGYKLIGILEDYYDNGNGSFYIKHLS